jgi:hypothetical protein
MTRIEHIISTVGLVGLALLGVMPVVVGIASRL